MSTSGLKVFVVVAAVVVGVFVIAQGFPTPSAQPAASPSPSASKSPKAHKSPQVQGVAVAVFNGTSTPNVAAKWAGKLQSQGYVIAQQGNAPHVTVTTVYYTTQAQKLNATGLQMTFFPNATLALMPTTLASSLQLKPGVQITVVVGPDYASAA
jgi:hypothetical protein